MGASQLYIQRTYYMIRSPRRRVLTLRVINRFRISRATEILVCADVLLVGYSTSIWHVFMSEIYFVRCRPNNLSDLNALNCKSDNSYVCALVSRVNYLYAVVISLVRAIASTAQFSAAPRHNKFRKDESCVLLTRLEVSTHIIRCACDIIIIIILE